MCVLQLGEDHPKEVEELWSALCNCWPNNLRVIIRYLFIITGMAATELLPYVSTALPICITVKLPCASHSFTTTQAENI